MENTFDKILKDGERKGYFRVLNDGAKTDGRDDFRYIT